MAVARADQRAATEKKMRIQEFRNQLTEDELLTLIVDRARAYGWHVHHDRPARSRKGWVTAIQGHAGFPDLVLARNGTVIYAELKSSTGRLSARQSSWMTALGQVHVWRPEDWPHIQELLK